MQLSFSRISTWKSCRKSYYFSYDLGLVPKRIRPEVSLGSSIHDVLSTFYSNKPDDRTREMLATGYETGIYQALGELTLFSGGSIDRKDKDIFDKNLSKGKVWLDNYWSKYRSDIHIPKAETEKLLEVQLDDITLIIKPDAIINKDDGIWTLEHKTGNPDITQLLLEDEQSLYYIFGLRKLGYDVKGTIYNIISNPTRMSDGLIREETERTDNELSGIEDEIKQIASEINTLPRYPHRGYLCEWCFYRELCRGIAYGGDVDYLIQQHFNKKEGK